MIPVIQVDFNNQDESERVRLNLPVSQRDLDGFEPAEGQRVLLTDLEVIVSATLLREANHWVAQPNWETCDDLVVDGEASGLHRFGVPVYDLEQLKRMSSPFPLEPDWP